MRAESLPEVSHPPSAASRIQSQQTFNDILKEKWNRQIAQLFRSTSEMEDKIRQWGDRNVLKGASSTGAWVYMRYYDAFGR